MGILLKIYKKKDTVLFVSILLLFAKALGFIKLRVIADLFGASHDLDLFWAAFLIPDTLYIIIAAGAINSAIIPIFSDVLHQKGEGRLVKLFTATMIAISIIAVLTIIPLYIFAAPVSEFIINSGSFGTDVNVSDGFSEQDLETLVQLMRIMLLSPLLLGISTVSIGFLQTHKRFFVTTLAPLMYNLGIVVGSVVFVTYFDMGIYGVAWAVVFGSLLHFGIQLPVTVNFIRKHLNIRSYHNINGRTSFYLKELWEMAKLAIPRIIGYFAEQLNAVLNTVISFSLSTGALSAYKFAHSLHLFPIQIFAGAMAQVLLPNLAEFYSKGEKKLFRSSFNRGLRITLFVTLPSAVFLVVLRLPIVRLVFGVGEFDWWDTVVTSWALALLAGAVIGQSIAIITLRGLYAIHETKIPLFVTLLTIVVNLVAGYYFTNFFSHYLDWRPIVSQVQSQVVAGIEGQGAIGLTETLSSFVGDLGVWFTTRNVYDASVGGLALSLSLSFTFEWILLLFFLDKKMNVVSFRGTFMPISKMVISSIAMAFVMYFFYRLSDFGLDTTKTISVIGVFIITVIPGGFIYLAVSSLLGVDEMSLVRRYIDKGKDILLNILP
jgi:putative peptidoglycan lipid II flippase